MLLLPSDFHGRAEFYLRLAQFLGAGLSPAEALEDLAATPPQASLRRLANALSAELSAGRPLGECFRRHEPEFGLLDVALVEAGERSGRLAPCFQQLADYYRERGELAASFLGQVAYPAFVLHFGFLVFGVLLPWAQSQFTRSLPALLLHTLLLLLPLYGLGALLILALQGRAQGWRSGLERVLGWVPMLGPARRALALSRLAFALEALVAAGVHFPQAWSIAARASSSPRLLRIVDRWNLPLQAGQTPSALVGSEPAFHGFFANLYATGEKTGTLQESLHRLAEHFRAEGVAKARQFTAWMPRLLYLGVAGFLAWRIVSFYRGYFQTIDSFFKP